MKRYIVHLDMDAFFAAVEQRDDPALRGKPVVVGADPRGGKGRGVVSTCSYEARVYGIHSAMPISQAYKRCPYAVFVPVAMEKYSAVSDEIYEILYEFTPDIEPVSIDEFFLDISGTYHLFGSPVDTCKAMQRAIKDQTGLSSSVGLAPVKMIAKIASDLEKPAGLVVVNEHQLQEFLWPLHVSKMWGIGKKAQGVLAEQGIHTIGDIARRDMQELINIFGRQGARLWHLARGIDEREVVTETEAKSISNEVTFSHDTHNERDIMGTLSYLCEKVSCRLRDQHYTGRTVTLKIRLEGFETVSRAYTLPQATNFYDVLFKTVKTLFEAFDRQGKRIRLLGVKVSRLETGVISKDLFTVECNEKNERMHEALDAIREKFGDKAIHRVY